MNKKYLAAALGCLIIIGFFISQSIVDRHNKNLIINLHRDEVQRIHISYTLPLFDELDISDTKNTNAIIDYLNSINLKSTHKNPDDYAGGGYMISVYFKDGTERTLHLYGNMFLFETNRFAYEISYGEAIKFDTIIAGILEEKLGNKGASTITGTVTSAVAEQSGAGVSCIIRAEGNVKHNIDLKGVKIMDATGAGNMLVQIDDDIKVLYLEDVQTDKDIIHPVMVFIERASR
ncbi:MAG: hypothetical protein Q8930_13780 [Bacillota bacterium]|nr:hypothetical protein [Bacillota bacterium]